MVNSLFNGWRMEDVWLDNREYDHGNRTVNLDALAGRIVAALANGRSELSRFRLARIFRR
jgi:hypothetical protein